MISTDCPCPRSRRAWREDGVCSTCRNRISESQLQDEIRLALGRVPGLVLWRNNVGEALVEYGARGRLAALLRWVRGRQTEPPPDPPELRPLVYGLYPGSADLIGCYRGRFVAIEIKTPDGVQSEKQRIWQGQVELAGGAYLMPRSVRQAVEMVEAIGARGSVAT